jgi:SAM-dependent methyltransferase
VDWRTWHDEYDRPDSWMAQRLRVVRERIRTALDSGPPGPLRVVSLCAGQGRDLLGVLADHPRRDDVLARLVELDPGNTAVARERARAAGLPGVEVVTGDAARTDHYADFAPADLVLVCGVFGNITDDDIHRTVGYCARLCATGGTVVWTRHRDEPDRVPVICRWFEQNGFTREWVSTPDTIFGVGVHRHTGRPQPLRRGETMFTFVGYENLPG